MTDTVMLDQGAIRGTKYYYLLMTIDNSGNETEPFHTAAILELTDTNETNQAVRMEYILSQNYPVPFYPSTTFS